MRMLVRGTATATPHRPLCPVVVLVVSLLLATAAAAAARTLTPAFGSGRPSTTVRFSSSWNHHHYHPCRHHPKQHQRQHYGSRSINIQHESRLLSLRLHQQRQQQQQQSISSSSIHACAFGTLLPRWPGVGHRHGKKDDSTITTTKLHQQWSASPLFVSDNDGSGRSPCVIKVVGVGGGGCNAVDRMLDDDTTNNRVVTLHATTTDTNPTDSIVGGRGGSGIDFWALNTDAQVLGRSQAKGANIMNIGSTVTRGLGAGGNPESGRLAAEENRKEIRAFVQGTDLCFVTAGMGGGTGSGAAPVVAKIAKDCGILTVGIVTKPFAFEGKRRMNQAIAAIELLRRNVDTIIVVSNDRLLEIIPKNTPVERAFAVADEILRQGVVGISDIIVYPGLINVDFADVRAIMSDGGTAMMGIGVGSGKTAAEDAAMAAISSPLLDTTIDNAKGVVFNISGGPNLTLNDVNRAAKLIYDFVAPDANVIFGALVDDTMGDNISITVLATGFTTSGSDAAAVLRSEAIADNELCRSEAPSESLSSPNLIKRPPDEGKIPSFLKSIKK